MKPYSFAVFIGIFAMVLELFSTSGHSQVLELGESQLHGKKDQPEALTILSRAQVPASEPMPVFNARDRIKKEIDSDSFSVMGRE